MTSNSEQKSQDPEKKENFFWAILKFTVITLAIVIPFRLYIAQPFIVSGASMDPTFENGEYLVVDQLSYKFEEPKRGSVVIFKYPKDPSRFYIKRVIGLPKETVEINGESVRIINKENKIIPLDEPYVVYKKEDYLTVTLKENEYFVMGDNRLGSSDSRAWRPVPRNLIVGRPLIRLLPPTHISLFPGDKSK